MCLSISVLLFPCHEEAGLFPQFPPGKQGTGIFSSWISTPLYKFYLPSSQTPSPLTAIRDQAAFSEHKLVSKYRLQSVPLCSPSLENNLFPLRSGKLVLPSPAFFPSGLTYVLDFPVFRLLKLKCLGSCCINTFASKTKVFFDILIPCHFFLIICLSLTWKPRF